MGIKERGDSGGQRGVSPCPNKESSLDNLYCVLFRALFSHSIVFCYFFALITEEGFLTSSGSSLELCIQTLISFLFSFASKV